MSIERRVQLVEMLFYDLELEGAQFKKESGLGCVAGCGKCCTHPDLDASPLEFLPWAFHLFLNGEAENTLDIINETDTRTCHIYKSLSVLGKGRCTDYKYRGLICRLFGFGASRDKYGNLRLATCKIIKEGQAENYNATVEAISNGMQVPIFTEYYMKLNQIDHHMGNKILPVNKALKLALEEVLQYYHYRPDAINGLNCG
ncbi:YkgJ family cysteine cluster protein [Brumimicrobium glaciale]|uniref:YkgJ family cysteine cluster protein n=1 Tax=Brumimicrobium glaciale TaxID=200475 RepID=A0A4V1WFS3_9FLAO|nr:YkgJ family cysteine cluster protein [Brumimicrobium glaciale]RYM34196.1 YkgJ family cysteine cluster protein [Brumimicrobium glaciale]